MGKKSQNQPKATKFPKPQSIFFQHDKDQKLLQSNFFDTKFSYFCCQNQDIWQFFLFSASFQQLLSRSNLETEK
jgi:hypothetical protein